MSLNRMSLLGHSGRRAPIIIGAFLKRQQRQFHLLPSQELSLLSEHIASVAPPTLASSPSDAASIANSLPGQQATLIADIQDAHPQDGRFVTTPLRAGEPSFDAGLKGTVHHTKGEKMAKHIAKKVLGSHNIFMSSMPPFALKKAGKVIVAPAPSSAALRLQVLLLADRKGHPHPSRPGMHYGPTLTVSTLPASIPVASARRSFPELTSLTCIDVGRIKPMGAIEERCDPAAEDILRATAKQGASESLANLERDLALGEHFGAQCKVLLQSFLEDLFVLYWKADGERFTLEIELSQDGSKVHVHSQNLTFDDYTTGKAGRQKLLTALRARPEIGYKAGMRAPEAQTRPGQIADATSAVLHDLSALEAEAALEGLIYRKHQNGNIALFGYGAGMGMGTLDGVIAEGGHPSNFFDGGGSATRENARAAIRIISQDPSVKAVLVNIFGGITKSDQVALGIIDAFEQFGLKHKSLPLIARFKGNKAQEAQETLAKSGLNVKFVRSLRIGAQEAIKAATAFEQTLASEARWQGAFQTKGTGRQPYGTLTVFGQPPGTRSLSTSARLFSKQPYHFVTGYAFAGKPRDPEGEQQQQAEGLSAEASGSSKAMRYATLAKQIGFMADTEIGRWRDELLQGGEAGEDAIACADMSKASGDPMGDEEGDVVIGVADGVGGWTENGVDPSLFSQALMYHVTQQAAKFRACPERLSNDELDPSKGPAPDPSHHPGLPQALLSHAYDAVQKEPLVIAGSATACVITLDSSKGVLRSANLGDSGFIILRQGWNATVSGANPGGKDTLRTIRDEMQPHVVQPKTSRSAPRPQEDVYFASTPLQYGFNTPYQLAKLPASMTQEGSIANTPRDAALWDCKLRDGDIVLAGTDGLWDNVHTAEIVQLMRFIREKHHSAWNARRNSSTLSASPKGAAASSTMRHLDPTNVDATTSSDPLAEERSFVQLFAHNLVEYCKMCQFSQTKRSPFEREAERYGIHYPGGKVDDVAIVVALATER
ncbi:hypothetical protein K437DRAFT_129323 [Tilletiaria anomala UBC 951]|uniref:PPM-type phosphatase domain-containing protein n=1 Tax=Tilletiaria anomala (strain ATCC 24038 / CBS 436.72 / UBC 951) TaxID=1037660 RepID=A0A066W0X6_TILAU|nr:uncharacterized protein K437DRAFT_129323 [Tilletiaria anomala UBC 951]KDN44724.1 hypothetical protein K437DRAFT_129323 [Tilletiaria anomala UBC 951]